MAGAFPTDSRRFTRIGARQQAAVDRGGVGAAVFEQRRAGSEVLRLDAQAAQHRLRRRRALDGGRGAREIGQALERALTGGGRLVEDAEVQRSRACQRFEHGGVLRLGQRQGLAAERPVAEQRQREAPDLADHRDAQRETAG